jgi:hypothetical protein
MQASKTSSPVLFANTGVQIICFPLKPNLRFTAEQVGYGWQRCKSNSAGSVKDFWYIQWQLIPSQNQLLLAVDTTLGPNEKETDTGYFCKEGRMLGDFDVSIEALLGTNGQPLEGIGAVRFLIRSATAEGGDPKDVHLVVDFGNNRTGGLLIEFHGDVAQDPMMHPLQLMHRYHLDAWDEKGEVARNHATWWFSSRSHWCASPYLDPPKIDDEIYVKDTVDGWLGKKQVDKKTTVYSTPDTFQDFSQVRVGREAHDLSLVMRTDGEVRTSLSSPKRYLWSKDASWLEGSNWYMADPNGRFDNERHAATLRGPLLRYLSEDDRVDEPGADYDESPIKPTHAPRVLMMGAMYEILVQAYGYTNSPTYRRTVGEPHRMRRLRSVTLTYPSGMILTEREELQRQARKAVYLFHQTAGRSQDLLPEFNLSIDEASAVHLTYMWSEIQKLGKKPSLWFQLMGREEPVPEAAPETPEPEAEEAPETASTARRPAARRRPKPGSRDRGGRASSKMSSGRSNLNIPPVRIACIDIGGGTSDLMIAKYSCDAQAGGDKIVGETLHRDGIYLAGDHLVKRLLECIIIPQFADAIGLEDHDVLRLFGPQVPGSNTQFRAQRINWVNRLFVPLAQKYLEHAVDLVEDEEISHTDPDLVAPEVVESLQATIDRYWGAGYYQVNQPLQLFFNGEDFEDIVDEVFGDLILDFCESIVEHQADVVLLAGLPTKLQSIQELVQRYLPLQNSRIIPMYNRYVGTWYPYQNPDHLNPGVIVDPKSTVVVGAAVEFSSRFGMLSQFKFRMEDKAAKQSYYWGVMTESRIDGQKILFESIAADERPAREEMQLGVSDRRLVIGRKRRDYDDAQATPVYVIKVHVGQRLGEIDVQVTVVRTLGPGGEEQLEVTEVSGDVAGEPAELDKNVTFEWRTLADERYYLDTGGLDKIELGV